METVLIIGASEKAGRYSRMAQELLLQFGHQVIPVSPTAESILGLKAYQNLDEISELVDTVTLYVRPEHLRPYVQGIIQKGVKRVIFNPGTEAPEIEAELEAAGIQTLRGCTLVMLKTGQF